jgi:aryl-alcohol dehydrogenase (NADP+)
MIGYVTLGTNDLPRAAAFYDALLGAMGGKRMMETEFRKESLAIAQKIRAFAEKKGTSAGHFAINWVLNNAIVTSVIGGPRTLEQWQDYLKALDFKFEPKGESLVDSLVSIGHPSTPGYNDPQYPLTGRVPLVG